MSLHISIVALSIALCLALPGCKSSMNDSKNAALDVAGGGWNLYGETVVVKESDIRSLGLLEGDEKNVWVEGEITEVCTHQGCWIRIMDSNNPAAGDLFVRTKDHAYLVPINSIGRNARVYGECEYGEMSVNDQKHYAEEAGWSEAKIATITQPRKMITFHAATIMIEGEGLDTPLDQ